MWTFWFTAISSVWPQILVEASLVPDGIVTQNEVVAPVWIDDSPREGSKGLFHFIHDHVFQKVG